MVTSVHVAYVGMQQDRLTELRKEKSTDKERAELKKNLLKVTRQHTDIAQQYAVRVSLHPASARSLPSTVLAAS